MFSDRQGKRVSAWRGNQSDGRKAGVAPALCNTVSHVCRMEIAVCVSGVGRVGGEKLESAATDSGLRHRYLNCRGMRDWA